MTTTDKLSDEALENIVQGHFPAYEDSAAMAREILSYRRASQAAPAPQQKPAAWAETDHKGKVIGVSMNQYPWHPTPLYAAPAPSDGLRAAAVDLLSWFDEGPSSYGPWIIPAGPQGADDAVFALRAALTPAPAQEVNP